ncbi:OmpA family protein [Alphaproteobacteria bacterium HT1-32]|nr:OmpA family protein [Alphaproteobacteria bacterium HT1-32]
MDELFTGDYLMMKLRSAVAAGAALLLLAGCSGLQVQNAEKVSPKGTAFQQALYSGYLRLAQAEYAESDYDDSDAFANRAIAAGNGSNVAPEEIAARDLPADSVAGLTAARAALVSALASPAAAAKPAAAAAAQVGFDCWMQEQEENMQPDHIAACKKEYDDAMAMLKMTPAPVALPAVPGPFTVLFATNSSAIDSENGKVIVDAASGFAKAKAKAIILSGHTDAVGNNAANVALSERRADTVKAALIDLGVPASAISTTYAGEAQLKVKVPTAEKQNRRVEIKLSR